MGSGINIYEARKRGREYCQTDGSEHYREGGLEPMDLIIAKGLAEDFCISNIVKYAIRFKKTQNLKDLAKVSDYAHILCGVKDNEQMSLAHIKAARTYRCADGITGKGRGFFDG